MMIMSNKKYKISFLKALVIMLAFTLLFPASPVSAAQENEAEQLQLTIDQAVDMAINYSRDLKSLGYTIEQVDEALESARDLVKYTPADGDNPAVSQAYLNLVSTEITQQQNKKQIEVVKDKIAYNVNKQYIAVLTAQEAVKLAEDALEYAKYQRDMARVGYQHGTVSLIEKNNAEREYVNKEAALTESRINLESSYKNLNTLLGLNEDARPVLTDTPEYSSIGTVNLESKIAQILDGNPQIWSAEKDLEQAKLKLTLYSGGTGMNNYTSTELGVYKSALSLESVKEKARTTIRNSYETIMGLEQKYQSVMQQLEMAQDNLKVTELKYDLGMATKGELLSARVTLNNARNSLNSLIYNHELAKISFQKPWVIS